MLGGGAAADALNMSSPEEGQLAITDIIEPDRHVKKGKGITVFPLDELEELRRQVISELFEGGLQLCAVDRTRMVLVEVFVDVLPVLDVFPESSEFVEPNSSAAVGIEYRHQEFDGVEIEGTPVSID
jgi:hypothetical protein